MGSFLLAAGTQITAIREQATSQLVDEVVVLSMKDGKYYGLNSVGSRVWELIQQPQSLSSICDVISAEYEVSREQCEADVVVLIEDLAANNLIELNDAPATSTATADLA